MNTNPNAKRILCYGDSNTWGYEPGSGQRLPADQRWPGVLQNQLGADYEVIEEGLNGRITSAEDPRRPGKNGEVHLIPCLESQNPTDLIVLMLGTNDLRKRIGRTALQAAQGLEDLVCVIREYGRSLNEQAPKILIVSPIWVGEGVEDEYQEAVEKSKWLGKIYEETAERRNCSFLDAAQIAQPSSKDHLHLDADGHQKLTKALYQKILSLNT